MLQWITCFLIPEQRQHNLPVTYEINSLRQIMNIL